MLKQKHFISRKKNSSIKRSSFNNDLDQEKNSLNKFDVSLDKNIKYLKEKEKEKRFRLYSSNRINPNKNFLKKISFLSPKIADAMMDNNEKIIKSFMH